MNIRQIKLLAKLLNDENLTLLEICEGETKIRLEKAARETPQPPAAPQSPALQPAAELTLLPVEGEINFNDIKSVKSPMVGVFYLAPAPGAQPFVKIGDKVKKGDVLCIVEAMKLMNEICAEFDAEIVDICALDGQIVEYGQIIFKLF